MPGGRHIGSEFTRMLLARMGVVFLISAAFAGAFAGLVHLAEKSERYDSCALTQACSRP